MFTRVRTKFWTKTQQKHFCRAKIIFARRRLRCAVWKIPCIRNAQTAQTAHLNLRRANIIFARQKCFYLMIPLCLNACQHMTWHVSAQVARTDSRAFVKCKQGLPASFTVWLSFHFPASRGLSRRGKNERPLLAGNHFIFRQNRKSRSSSFGLFFTSKPNGNAGARVTLSTLLAG